MRTTLDKCAKKRGGGFLTLPFWPEKVGPGARREVPRGPENRPKKARREDEEAMLRENSENVKNVDPVERNAWFWWPGRAENSQKSAPEWFGRPEKVAS